MVRAIYGHMNYRNIECIARGLVKMRSKAFYKRQKQQKDGSVENGDCIRTPPAYYRIGGLRRCSK